MSRLVKIPRWACTLIVVISVVESCGPPLTDPSSMDITGRWATSTAIGPLSALQMTIAQGSDGSISGQWSAVVSPPNPSCPPGLDVDPVGSVTGANTVLEAHLALLGAGDFDGQVIDSETLKGSFVSCSQIYPIVFSRLGSLPAP